MEPRLEAIDFDHATRNFKNECSVIKTSFVFTRKVRAASLQKASCFTTARGHISLLCFQCSSDASRIRPKTDKITKTKHT